MKKYIHILYIFLAILSCKKPIIDSNFIIDKNIEEEVNSKISESEFGTSFDKLFLMYDNALLVDVYKNDTISFSSKSEDRKMPFKSFFYKRNDTLSIDGAYGLFGGFGFSLKLVNNKSRLYHLAAGDDFPMYAMRKDGELKFRIEVPCTETKIVLSKIPEAKEDEIIYGMVEFKSEKYYEANSINSDGESSEREECQVRMTIYFKSRYFDFEKPLDEPDINFDILEE